MKTTKTTHPAAAPIIEAARAGKIKTQQATQAAVEAPRAEASPSLKADEVQTQGSGDDSQLKFPEAPSGSAGGAKVQGTKQWSIGDPHETTGDGMKFDNMEVGDFVKVRSKHGDFEVQTRHEPWSKNPQTTVNTMVGVKVNGQGDRVQVAADGAIKFNGKAVEVKEGEPFEIPGGGLIERSGDELVVTSAAGDRVRVLDRGEYLDMGVEASPERVDGDISGSLGRLDSDTDFRNDLVDREGNEMSDVAAFIEEWRAQPGESMFEEAGVPGTPEEGPEAPIEGEAPVEAPAAGGAPEDDATSMEDLLAKVKDLLAKLQGEAPAAEQAPAEEEGAGDAGGKAPKAKKGPGAKPQPEKKAAPGSALAEVLAMIAAVLRRLEEEAAARQADERTAELLNALP